MIDKAAILHIPCSEYAYPLDEETFCVRLRAGRRDLVNCELYVADRACETTPIRFEGLPMERIARDERFDFFQAVFPIRHTRLCYYFRLQGQEEWTYYYGDIFTRELADLQMEGNWVDGRSEYFQYPAILRTEIARPPKWMNTAFFYNVFPDSFADGSEALAGPAKSGGRLGGTLRGVTENLEHIARLGCNGLYLNPIFTAKSYHKYDTIDYYHVDPCFGTDDDLRSLVQKAHKMGMRVVLDGVFNHSGTGFFAFQDVLKRGTSSPYFHWYDFVPPTGPGLDEQGHPNYACFAYVPEMPKLNTANPQVQAYFAEVGRYWVEEFRVDGWRLDVANEISKEFWRVFRRAVKAADPDCVLIGEVWENARDWLRYDLLDSVMNYDFRRHCRDFFALGRIDAAGFAARVTNMVLRYPEPYLRAQLNLLDSHDVCRFLSLCGGDERRMRLAVVFQMLFPGAPCVFYGDEAGLTGVTEPEYRRPMDWENAEGDWFAFYRQTAGLRAEYLNGTERFTVLAAAPQSCLFGYALEREGLCLTVWLNAGDAPCPLPEAEEAERLWEQNASHEALGPWGCRVCRQTRRPAVLSN